MRKFGPETQPIAGEKCFLCGEPFAVGDMSTLIGEKPADLEETVLKREGKSHLIDATKVHWDCVARLATAFVEAMYGR